MTVQSSSSTYLKMKEAAEYIKRRTQINPEIGGVLGSGLQPVADPIQDAVTIPYQDIPYFHGTSVEGHAGKLVAGKFSGVPCVFLQGRFHYYEGYPMDEVVFPVRVLCAMGIQTLILTNAAGGINTRFRPGDVMAITDHMNLMGDNPLRGKHLADLGPRFPDLSETYRPECIRILEECAQELDIQLQKGVYAAVLGPTYETPAEIRMLRTLGADAVGMSTVPEAIAASHLGVQVIGLSGITNLAAGSGGAKLTHTEVLENSKAIAEKMKSLLIKSFGRLKECGIENKQTS